MSNVKTLNPLIPDPEIFQDFVDALGDHIPAIERDIGRLKNAPEDRAVLADLFRANDRRAMANGGPVSNEVSAIGCGAILG